MDGHPQWSWKPASKFSAAAAFFVAAACSPGALPLPSPEPPNDPPKQAVTEPASRPDARAVATAVVTEAPSSPVVAANATAREPTLPPPARIGALEHHVWIMPKPSRKGLALGKVRLGTSVMLKDTEAVKGSGCKRDWLRVKPRGYVCHDRRTTLDLDDPYYRALSEFAPKQGVVWPYRYAYSRGAPMYSRIPTREEWLKAERGMLPPGRYQKLGAWAKGHEELIDEAATIEATDAVPWFFEGGKRHVGGGSRDPRRLKWRTMPNGAMLAYARAVAMHGRVWLLTPDLMVVPAERVQVMRRSEFVGVNLEQADISLPLAWNRSLRPRHFYEQEPSGEFVPAARAFGPKAWVEIVDQSVRRRGHRYFPLRDESGLFVRKADVTFTRARRKLPRPMKAGQKWVDARIVPGTITAYVGLQPVYATLFSPGKGGAAIPGYDPEVYAMTKTGVFFFEWKEHVATMTNEMGEPKIMWITDVPHIQYLRAPLAMHVSFWHEDFSNKKSAECLNVSPRDGRWLFGFTEPQLPPDWSAIRPGGGNGKSTPIMVNAF